LLETKLEGTHRMASPFNRSKKERRRLRKSARAFVALDAKLAEANSPIAGTGKRIAEMNTRLALSRRPRKAKNSN
jgi:hypothetical protein